MNILVVHQNFPGQFPHIVTALLARGDRVAAIGGPTAKARPGVDLRRWKLSRGTTKGIFDPATRAEADLIRAAAAAGVAEQLKRDGYTPDVIIGHPGWGETIHLKLVWPEAKLILFGEYWYRGIGGDADFDPEFGAVGLAEAMRISAKNATGALAYVQADHIVSPTAHQASTFPASLQDRIAVVHEGVDVDRAKPLPDNLAGVRLPDGRRLDRRTPYITFVSRTLEPLRGFHIFMRALPAFLSACPNAHAVIIGEDKPSGYGVTAPSAGGWKMELVKEQGDQLDLSRVHFLGCIEHRAMIAALSGGAAHVYYTYPFVLSWSLVEAMACGCFVIASDNDPVRDAIEDGVNGVLLPFFSPRTLAEVMVQAVTFPEERLHLRQKARERATNAFNRALGTEAWLAAIDGHRSA